MPETTTRTTVINFNTRNLEIDSSSTEFLNNYESSPFHRHHHPSNTPLSKTLKISKSLWNFLSQDLGEGGAFLLLPIKTLAISDQIVRAMFRYSSKGHKTVINDSDTTGNNSISSGAVTPPPQLLPLTRSRLPLPRSTQKPPSKRTFSPELQNIELLAAHNSPASIWNENLLMQFNSSFTSVTPSPSKHSRYMDIESSNEEESDEVKSVSQIVKHRLSLMSSPLNSKTRSNAPGIFSSSSAAQSTRRLSLGSNVFSTSANNSNNNNRLNSYGMRPTASDTMNRRKSTSFTSSPSINHSDRIRVCVRKRPLNGKEASAGHSDILETNNLQNSIAVLENRVKLDGISKFTDRHEFHFDQIFDVNVDNYQIYEFCVKGLVENVLEGGKATCFAYGQTGSGKTHTMLNPGDGLYHLAAKDLITATSFSSGLNVNILVSFYEIYQNSLYDLLNEKRRVMACEGKDGEVQIVGIKEVLISSVEELQSLMESALNTRSTGSTTANASSSRSHAILQFILKRNNATYGKFSFIDLAGSERGSDRANVNKQTKLEGAEINKSLLALKECIRAIDQDSTHLPFRQSKLTLVLKDSFMGNAKTCMIATVSPSSSNCEHTINTLRYADRVKELKGPSGCRSEEIISTNTSTPTKSTTVHSKESNFNANNTPFNIAVAIKSHPTATKKSIFDNELRRTVNTTSISTKTSNIFQSFPSSPLKTTASTFDSSNDDFCSISSVTPVKIKDACSGHNVRSQNEVVAVVKGKDFDDFLNDDFQIFSSKPKSLLQLRDSLHHSIAILYDRVSASKDTDLLEILQDELDSILTVFNK